MGNQSKLDNMSDSSEEDELQFRQKALNKLQSFMNVWLPTRLNEIEYKIRLNIYMFQDKFDPPPKIKKSESFEDWLMRIDLKYAIRFVTMTKFCNSFYEQLNFQEALDKSTTKKGKKDILEFAQSVIRMIEVNDGDYELVMRRKYVEQEMERTS